MHPNLQFKGKRKTPAEFVLSRCFKVLIQWLNSAGWLTLSPNYIEYSIFQRGDFEGGFLGDLNFLEFLISQPSGCGIRNQFKTFENHFFFRQETDKTHIDLQPKPISKNHLALRYLGKCFHRCISNPNHTGSGMSAQHQRHGSDWHPCAIKELIYHLSQHLCPFWVI